MEDSSLLGRKALITGACQGGSLGREIISGLIRSGSKVIATDTSNEDLECLKTEIPNVETAHLDITKFSDIFEVVESIGPVDFLLNKGQNYEETPSEIKKNVKGLVEVSEIIVRHLISRKAPGVIINLCTENSYKETKNLTRIAASELRCHNIRVNCINCTLRSENDENQEDGDFCDWLYRDEDPSGRKFKSNSEIVRVILDLLSEKSKEISGICLPEDAQLLDFQ